MTDAYILENSKYQDLDLNAKIIKMDRELTEYFKIFHLEYLQNMRRLGGNIYSKADLDKLEAENRPDFVYNYLLPFIINLTGNFRNSFSKVKPRGVQESDEQLAEMMGGVLDYWYFQENNLVREFGKAYLNALTKLGFISVDWVDDKMVIRNVDPTRMKFDIDFNNADLSDAKYIIESAWYSPEELLRMAKGEPDLYDEMNEYAKLFLGEDTRRKNKIISFVERVFGSWSKYMGNKTGFDSETNLYGENNEYFNINRGTFKALEVHDKRTEIKHILTDFANMNEFGIIEPKRYDITKAIDGNGYKFDSAKFNLIKRQYPDSHTEPKHMDTTYKSVVVPAWNMKIYEGPAKIQDRGLFKYIPVWCFNFDPNPLENKSYIDHLIDPVSSYNKRRNTILTLMMKSANGEVWYEESALGEFEDDFLSSEIGARKKVKDGSIVQNRIHQVDSAPNFAGLAQIEQEDKISMKEITGIHENSMGQTVGANESGVAVQRRTAQTDLMQTFVHENAAEQLKALGYASIELIQKYMTEETTVRLLNDEGNPYWLTLNQRVMGQVLNDVTIGQFDIVLDKQPFGINAKREEFEKNMIIADKLAQLNPAFVNPEILIKTSDSIYKEDWLAHIRLINGRMDMMLNQQMAQQEMEKQQNIANFEMQQQQNELGMRQQQLQIQDTEQDLGIDEMLLKLAKAG